MNLEAHIVWASLQRDYMVIVNLGCSLRKFKWTKEFMNRYESKLTDEYTDDCRNISHSNYCFTTGDFRGSISYSGKVSKRSAHYYYTSMMRILKSYCELNDETGISFAFDNMKQYLKRNTSINSYDERILKPFISFFSEYLKIRQSVKDRATKKELAGLLIKKIESYEDILYSRNWMVRKLGEI